MRAVELIIAHKFHTHIKLLLSLALYLSVVCRAASVSLSFYLTNSARSFSRFKLCFPTAVHTRILCDGAKRRAYVCTCMNALRLLRTAQHCAVGVQHRIEDGHEWRLRCEHSEAAPTTVHTQQQREQACAAPCRAQMHAPAHVHRNHIHQQCSAKTRVAFSRRPHTHTFMHACLSMSARKYESPCMQTHTRLMQRERPSALAVSSQAHACDAWIWICARGLRTTTRTCASMLAEARTYYDSACACMSDRVGLSAF